MLLTKKKVKLLIATTLLSTISFTATYAASPPNTKTSQTTINLMQTSTRDLTTKAKPASNFKVTLNGEAVTLSDPILSDNGSTLLPVRAIGNLLGIAIDYDADYKVAIATDEDTTLEIPLGYTFGVLNGTKKDIPNGTKSVVYNSKTYLPLRYMAENLGVTINYTASTRTIALTTTGTGVNTNVTPSPTVKPTPATDNSPQAVFDRNEKCSKIDASYLNSFSSVEEIMKLLPNLSDKAASNVIKLGMKYATVTMDITSDRISYEDSSRNLEKSYFPIGGAGLSNAITVFKDGTYSTSGTLPKGKTLNDISYFAYSRNNTYMIVKIGTVDLSSFIF